MDKWQNKLIMHVFYEIIIYKLFLVFFILSSLPAVATIFVDRPQNWK